MKHLPTTQDIAALKKRLAAPSKSKELLAAKIAMDVAEADLKATMDRYNALESSHQGGAVVHLRATREQVREAAERRDALEPVAKAARLEYERHLQAYCDSAWNALGGDISEYADVVRALIETLCDTLEAGAKLRAELRSNGANLSFPALVLSEQVRGIMSYPEVLTRPTGKPKQVA